MTAATCNSSSAILVSGPAWIGDMVMTQSLFKIIKQRNPNISIDVLAPSWSIPLLACMPEVRQAIESPFKHGELKLFERYRFAKTLRRNNYQQVIVIQNSLKSALIPFFSRIPQRTGYRGEMRWGLLNDIHYIDEKKFPMRIQHYAMLGLPAGDSVPNNIPYPALQIPAGLTSAALEKLQLATDKPILGISPGAEYGPAKRWPAEYFAAIAKTKKAEGWEIWIFGTQKEQVLAAEIQNLSNNACIDLTGKTSLPEAIYLLAATKTVVASDSGLLHVAAALQKSVVVLYGITPPEIAPPLSPQAKILWLGLPCSPCFSRECPLGHNRCMKDIKPEMVLAALSELG